MEIRDRIRELRWVPASTLRANPKNWREHPPAQRSALQGVLAEIGIAAALIGRDTPAGLELIDGHLRAEVLGDQMVAVLIVDLDDDEAGQLLATMDPLAAMATANQDKLAALLEQVEFASEGVNAMLANLTIIDTNDDPLIDDPQDVPIGDEQWQVLVECTGELQQTTLLERLTTEGFVCHSLIS